MEQHPARTITWQSMGAPRQTWWHAAYRSAVHGAIRGLAVVIDASPQRRRAA